MRTTPLNPEKLWYLAIRFTEGDEWRYLKSYRTEEDVTTALGQRRKANKDWPVWNGPKLSWHRAEYEIRKFEPKKP